MNGLDVVIVVAAVLAAVGGWRLGFLTRSVGWIGAGLGLALAVAVLPPLLDRLDLTSGSAVVLVGLSVLVVLASLGQGIGSAIGSRLAPPVRPGAARRLDQVGGAALGVVGVAVIAWLLFPVMSQTEGWSASSTSGSALAGFSLDHLPEPPAGLLDLERQALDGRFPQLFTGDAPTPELPPAPTDTPIDDARMAQLARSVVQVKGSACDMVQSGSGFVVAPGLVATNAHVVAGTTDVELVTTEGEQADAEVVAFDPSVDLALLATDLDRPALPLGPSETGDRGLVMGFPGGGPFRPSPFEVGESIDATGLDIYDRREVRRELLVLASDLEPGDSGSAVVRSDGTVVAVAVAIAPDRDGVAYALEQEQLRALLAGGAQEPVPTGECLT
ncbi:MarP family serine protease [Dermatobacter hominis]|uniref:MarP family serine protease n=1 Tax=Dermatobacter hominis TaxID=2884263 RepID=UPI001D127EAE|nr:MarP family serine protease [Dermatobacter hominis]UDY36399.1 MarP family serine protease [Dermatobacter hominis]